MSPTVKNRYGKVISIARSWRQMRRECQQRAAEARRQSRLDARSKVSRVYGGSLEPMSPGLVVAGWVARAENRGWKPVKSWKEYPSSRGSRQWKVL